MSHPNSRTVTIFRAGSYLERSQGQLALEHFAAANPSIGSYFAEKGSQMIGSGLSFPEQELLLPNIIGVEADDRDFKPKSREFFAEIDTKVPYETGISFEIGLTKDNNLPLSASNMPINIMDYIRYRHAKSHPFVAEGKSEADRAAKFNFYIFDKEAAKENSARNTQAKDAALKIYFELKNDITKVDQMLAIWGTDPREFMGKSAKDDKIDALRAAAEANPPEFIKKYEEGKLEIRYWISMMDKTGVIKQMGQKYIDAETSKPIANSLDELIFFFEDDDNSESVNLLKARFQEAMAKPIVTPKRRTQLAK